jgi:hypothetical protein
LVIHPTEVFFLSKQQERQKKASKFEQSGLTQEQLLEQQELLFAASRARYEATGGTAPAEEEE